MPKKLISVRLSPDLLEKCEDFKKNKNQERIRYHNKQDIRSRKSYLSCNSSVADVIEIALLEFFEDKKL